uniref:Uncharacterized protein n=1 Tax=Musca domestica TaxID=7370 RepID=A0A1I8M325_MUSDO
MTNKGYYIVLDLTYDGAPPLISDGPLKENEVYELDQIRFEWDRTTGVNDTAIRPMEMHILFRNTKKKDFDEASHADNGLAALAFFFAMGNDFYAGYGILAKFLKEIKTPNTSTAVPPMPLIHMMPKAIVSYYHYSGTLLAPPCSSSVIWMDFPTPIDLPLSLAILFNGLYTPHPYTNDKRPATGQLGSVINFVAEVNSVPDGSIAIDDWNGNTLDVVLT